jgi:hypothetical protein
MRIQDKTLTLNRIELIDVIQNNPHKDSRNTDIQNRLTSMIKRDRYFSDKQYDWILSKIQYVMNHNVDYRKKQGIDRDSFDSFWVWPDVWPIDPSLYP